VIEHVVFDLDGTLVDSFRDIAAALNEVLDALERPRRDPEEVKTMIGEGVGVLLERGLGDDQPELVAKAKARFKDAYAKHLLATTKPYEGVHALIAELNARGVTTSIATNKPSFFTQPIVEKLALDVRAYACPDDAGARKPDPRVVELAIERTGKPLDRARTIYVGDMPLDLETARRFGCPIVAVAWGFDPRGLKRLNPDHWIEEPSALLSLLSR
jgi:2-phosphoglycolate phosphatase